MGTRHEDWKEPRDRPAFVSGAQVLELAVQLSRATPGAVVQFGVSDGAATRVIRDELWRSGVWEAKQRTKRIFACDAFATWVPRLRGVQIVDGRFADTLTEALAGRVGRISFAHFDAESYSATKSALDWITPLVQPGTVLLFDEFCGEDPAEERAFVEWMANSGVRTALLAMFGREPSGDGYTSDRRALFQVLGDVAVRGAPPLPLVRWRRRLMAER
jgi:predicted O-methyltransferase YrrM